MLQVFHREEKKQEVGHGLNGPTQSGEFQSMPKGLIPLSPFAAKGGVCWPYAPSLIHVVSASAARRWRVERGEYSGTGPAIPPPLTRCADCCFGELRMQEAARAGKFSCDQF